MPGTPFMSVLSEDEIAAVAHAAVADLAHRLTRSAFRDPRDPDAPHDEAVRRDALAELRVLMHIQRAVEEHMQDAAALAADAGAGYPQLGNACRITRQGARRRWPGILSAAPGHHLAPHLPQASPRASGASGVSGASGAQGRVG
ncbi:hypothetical protein [Streptodolium elevatio]|uniref:Uncharacterized protein n=1 Tax=Streptodolium elevatio TaxID=3157996 RepID=A0ABV3DI03_9ACTN